MCPKPSFININYKEFEFLFTWTVSVHRQNSQGLLWFQLIFTNNSKLMSRSLRISICLVSYNDLFVNLFQVS